MGDSDAHRSWPSFRGLLFTRTLLLSRRNLAIGRDESAIMPRSVQNQGSHAVHVANGRGLDDYRICKKV